jgi:CRP-like cAMP-binding protein
VDTAIAEGVRYIILDTGRVTELDSTGASILLQAEEKLRSTPCRLMLSGVDARPELGGLMAGHGVTQSFAAGRMFPDLDRALEWCENDLLASQRSLPSSGELAFERLDLVAGMDAAEREALRGAVARCEYRAGETVFRQGEAGEALYIIARGSASVRLELRGSGDRRLMTFSQGTFFGEMALLDRETRSATITADEPLVCYVLQQAAFERLAREHPLAGLALLTNLGRALSLRMRRANRTMLELA